MNRFLPRTVLSACALWVLAAGAEPPERAVPALMLAEVYHPDVDLGAYWVSEKLDGVRGYWDGKQLWTRSGLAIDAPEWFTHGWPVIPMDGELWGGRGQFEATSATVRSGRSSEAGWRRLRFMVFDLPGMAVNFDTRKAALAERLTPPPSPWLAAVPQVKLADAAALQQMLAAVVADGGEGLMLHRGDRPYRAGRSDDLLKLKPDDDAEAKVVGHLPGQGKYSGQLGALLVETSDGRRFRIGSGFTDAQRAAPPAIGSWVTYRYNGLTDQGLPRFARFLRVRDDEPR